MRKSLLPFQYLLLLLLGTGFLLVTGTELAAAQVESTQNTSKIAVSGTITDAAGNPLAGVTVLEKDTQNGTISDANGQYRITVAEEARLVFKTVGFSTVEIEVDGKTKIDITLKGSTVRLNEVVAIGYGKQSRVDVTNAISKVGTAEFDHAPAANALNQLQGKVAGLSLQISNGQPGSNPQIFLRGGTTTSPEGDAPLIVVDGVVSQGMRSISDLNPDNIASIEVLKDAASTAIYGAKAANGIIIVTTKKGKSGKTKVSFKYTYGIETQAKKYDFLNARQYINVTRKNTMLYNKTNPEFYLTGGRYGMSTGNPRNSKNTLEFLNTYINDYGPEYVDDLLANKGWETMTDPVTGKLLIFKGTDFQDVTFQRGFKHDYEVNVSGGNEVANYYLGLGHMNQDGIVSGTFYKNYDALFNGSYKLSNRFKIHTGVKYQIRDSKGPNSYWNVLTRSILMPPTYRLYYEDGTPAPGEGISSFRSRAHEIYYKEKYTDVRVYRTTLQVGADWDIIDGLSFKPTLSWFTTEGKERYFEAYNEVNKNRNASADHNLDRDIQLDAVLNYAKSFHQVHNINMMLGSSYIKSYSYRMHGSGYGAPTDYIPTLNATRDETQRVSTTESYDALMSYFGRLNYDFNKKYLLSASFRLDGSSRFAKDHKWGFFPGVSAGWNMHLEDFWAPLRNTLSRFKLRASWGQAGNNLLSIYDSQGKYNTGYNYLGQVGILNTTLANNDLVWETTTSFDVGLDIGLFNNKIGLLLDYYNKVTSGRLFNKPLDASSGFNSIKSNYGSIRNRGIEVEVSATPVRTPALSWDLSMTFSYNRGIVTQLPDNGQPKNRIGGNYIYDAQQKKYVKVGGFAEGERFGGRWAHHLIGVYPTDEAAADAPYDRNAAGRTKIGGDAIWDDRDHNDTIDYRDMVFMGYIRPDIRGGMVNSLHYKGFTVRFVVDYAIGHVIDNKFRANTNGSSRNNNNALTDVLGSDIWKEPGDIAKIPRYSIQSDYDYNWRNHNRWDNGIGNKDGSNNSLYYSKGDYLAFREVSLSYYLQSDFLKKAYIAGIELFMGVYNVGYLTAYDGLMPEIYTGYDAGIYPRPRQYNMGIKLDF